ncbi:50S ribosomal protein L25 [Clostridium sp. D2Q-11]|uniref:Large ribosomal subunit protein bL25 n=1 Tax=Anaeromonas frigoriresistens TaxID=2683708 RepID=A0A942UW19_9FIRM|nr:50S ribosomal protein L25 [Anaeromonas frigoriresistens]MBS4537941.1 50S ribosomal protein L25 [Anaeromonas frigoriresistens]
MATTKLNVNLREEVGTGKAHALRRDGFVPGVLYGHNKKTRNIALRTNELQKLISDNGNGALVTIEVDGENIPAILKDVQKRIVKEDYLHVDFQQLSENEEIKLTIPVYVGNRESVEDSATTVQQQLMEIDIQCLPKYIINHVDIDASKLKDNHAITVGELELEGVNILNEDEEVIASLTYATKQEDEEEEEETKEPIYISEKSVLE